LGSKVLYLHRAKNPFLIGLSVRWVVTCWRHVAKNERFAAVHKFCVTDEATGARSQAVMWSHADCHRAVRSSDTDASITQHRQRLIVCIVCTYTVAPEKVRPWRKSVKPLRDYGKSLPASLRIEFCKFCFQKRNVSSQ